MFSNADSCDRSELLALFVNMPVLDPRGCSTPARIAPGDSASAYSPTTSGDPVRGPGEPRAELPEGDSWFRYQEWGDMVGRLALITGAAASAAGAGTATLSERYGEAPSAGTDATAAAGVFMVDVAVVVVVV